MIKNTCVDIAEKASKINKNIVRKSQEHDKKARLKRMVAIAALLITVAFTAWAYWATFCTIFDMSYRILPMAGLAIGGICLGVELSVLKRFRKSGV